MAKVAASNMFDVVLGHPGVQGDEVGLGQQFIQTRQLLDPGVRVDLRVWVIGHDAHPKGKGPAGDLVSNKPETDEPERVSPQVAADELGTFPVVLELIALVQEPLPCVGKPLASMIMKAIVWSATASAFLPGVFTRGRPAGVDAPRRRR